MLYSWYVLDAPLHTDEPFKTQLQEEHQRGISALAAIGVAMVSKFPVDSMHCVCYGVVRKLVSLWLRGPLSVCLDSASVATLSCEPSTLGNLGTTDF